jgi:hypothetical protein
MDDRENHAEQYRHFFDTECIPILPVQVAVPHFPEARFGRPNGSRPAWESKCVLLFEFCAEIRF